MTVPGLQTSWVEFTAALLVFFLSHVIPARPPVRQRLVGWLGTRPYLVAYSLISILILVWLISASGRAPYAPVWDYAPWQNWVPLLVMLPVCVLLVFGLSSPNPLSLGPRGKAFDPARPGIAGLVRHPVLWAALLWALSHMLPNGDVAHLILFGSFALLAAAGMMLIDRRMRRRMGAEAWERQAKATSNLPLAAWLRGNWRPRPSPHDWLRFGAAAGVYLLLLLLHQPVIGVSPIPV